jgi:glycosyltransferase involved in cell wall biosynthesis
VRIALIAPPFIEVPPARYGGTELFVANLARELDARGHDVILYANGESDLPCEIRWRYTKSDWPLDDAMRADLKNADHTAWAMRDAEAAGVDVIHLNDIVGLPFTMFVDTPTVLTIHHPHMPVLSEQYLRYPRVHYIAIGRWLARLEQMPKVTVIHHGIEVDDYAYVDQKNDYVAFLGRFAPCKGAHLAIEAARVAQVPLKMAGERQPLFADYWNERIAPRIDGRRVECLGEADRALKNELLSHARALLFPIEWKEPFGLVMIEAMACGTPVLAFAGGAVEEIVRNGVNGWICTDVDDMASRIATLDVPSERCRSFVAEHFSVGHMADRYSEVYERAYRNSRMRSTINLEA